MRLPQKRSGNSPADVEWNCLVDLVRSLLPSGCVDMSFSHGPLGTTYKPKAGRAGSDKPVLMTLRTVGADWLLCHTCDGITWNGSDGYTVSNEGTEDIYVAKPYKMRTGGVTRFEVKCGLVHRYTFATGPDTHNLIRTDAWGVTFATTEDQLMTPPWTLNEEVYAVPAQTTAKDPDGNDIAWLYVSPDRQWGKYTP